MGDVTTMMKRSVGILFEKKENLRVGFSAFQHANLVIPLREGLNREFGPSVAESVIAEGAAVRT